MHMCVANKRASHSCSIIIEYVHKLTYMYVFGCMVQLKDDLIRITYIGDYNSTELIRQKAMLSLNLVRHFINCLES